MRGDPPHDDGEARRYAKENLKKDSQSRANADVSTGGSVGSLRVHALFLEADA